MSYKIREGSIVIAVRHNGKHEAKQISKERVYPEATKDGEWLCFAIKPGSAWKEFRAKLEDVEETLDITGIRDGTYTIVLGEETDYVTLRLERGRNKAMQNGDPNFFFKKQVVEFLSGPDNETDFTAFAHIDEYGIPHVWKSFKKNGIDISRQLRALETLHKLGGEGREKAGLEYALRSGRCCRCGMKLTVPASLHRGMGPICAKGGTKKDD